MSEIKKLRVSKEVLIKMLNSNASPTFTIMNIQLISHGQDIIVFILEVKEK